MTQIFSNAARRTAAWLGIPLDAVVAGLVFLCALHQVVTELRIDRASSQNIPMFGLAALAGISAATFFAILRKRPLPDARAAVSVAALALVFTYFCGRLPVVSTVGKMGRPPELYYWYLGGTAALSAAVSWIAPVRPVEAFLLLALAFATPATRVLLRWYPEGFEVAPIGLAMAAVAHEEFRANVDFRWPPLAKAAFAFLAAVLLSSLFSLMPQTAWPAFGRTGLQIAMFVGAILYFRREGGGRRFVYMAASVASVVAFSELFIYQRFTALVGFDNARQTRLESFGIHPNLSAPFSMAGTAVCVGAVLCARTLAGRGAALVGAAACFLSLYLHKSGGATAGCLVGVAAIVICALAAKWRSRAFSTVVGGGLVVIPSLLIIAAVVLPSFAPRLKGGGESGKINVATRVEFWLAARQAVLEHPITGLGPKNVEAHAIYNRETVEANIDWSNHPHNILMEIAETIGIPGLLSLLVILGSAGFLVRKTLAANDASGDPMLVATGFGVLWAVLADGFVDHGFAEFAILPDALWFALAWIAIGSPRDDAVGASGTVGASGGIRKFTYLILSIGTTVVLLIGAAVPLVVSEIEQSIKWIHFWNNAFAKYDTFRDAGGQLGRLEILLKLAPSRSDIRITYATVALSREAPKAEDRERNLQFSIQNVERAVDDAPFNSDVLQNAAAFYTNNILGDYDKHYNRALDLYHRASRLGNPDERARANLGIARCFAALNKPDEAIDAMTMALQMSPSMPLYTFGFKLATDAEGHRDVHYVLGGPNKISVLAAIRAGVDKLTPKLASDFDTVWGPLARLAECYINISRADLAISLYQEIEKHAPAKRMNLPSALGQAKLAAGKYEDALVDIDRAIANGGGGYPFMSGLRSRALEGMSRQKEAIAESQKFVDSPMDVLSLRSQLRDNLSRIAFSEQTNGQYRKSAELFTLAARYEDGSVDRIRIEMNACVSAIRGYRQSQNAGYLDLLNNYFAFACDASGEMDWAELDREKILALGHDIGQSCGDKVFIIFQSLLNVIDKQHHTSPAAYWMVLGVGNAAMETAHLISNADRTRLSDTIKAVRKVAYSMTARVTGLEPMGF
ncbi:MAG: O-antigen ligase family protein [Planctomycetes bacterium]|nr:O-antigen ligase family protein [Planctomycetota bacterium]